jgi:hypothetical protein
MSDLARLIAGITLITVPTIVYGGLSVLSVISGGRFGLKIGVALTPEQTSYFRAGHAHAGVLVLFSLVIQLLLDHAHLADPWILTARIAAPSAAIAVSGGFFGIAFIPGFRLLLYTGALLMSVATLITGIGLVISG